MSAETNERDLARQAKAWPFQEAMTVVERLAKRPGDDDRPVIFETGYGPSGLPHIGTFGEVLRTTLVRQAFRRLSDRPSRLIAFSDDMDGLRKVPDNVPNRDMLSEHLGKPLTRVPDPFGSHESFGHQNNARLKAFLDRFGFDYEFFSSTECYAAGLFDDALNRLLACYDEVMAVILPTLGAERRATYSPFLPLSAETGRVLQVPILARDVAAGTIVYEAESGARIETPVTGGRVKLQWKADWAMRWYALGVDYEMSGKDLIDSVRLSGRICRILGGTPPAGFTYELFLDENGEKISKSRGNGLTIDEWLTYASPESLAFYMFQQPRRAKRLFFDVIPKAADEYLAMRARLPAQTPAERLGNPVWHIHDGAVPAEDVPLSFAVLMNLAAASNAEDKAQLWGFIARYVPGATPEGHPMLDQLAGYAVAYYRDFVKPAKRYRGPDARERAALADLAAAFDGLPEGATAEDLQTVVYGIGKGHGFEPLRDWFKALYEVLFGQSQGPRFGSFAAVYGVRETAALIRRALDGEDLSA